MPTITLEERGKLLSIARGFDSTERKLIVHENGETEWVDDQPDTLPSKKYNRVSAGEDVVVLLKKHGWRVVKRNDYHCSLLRHGVDVEPTVYVRWVDGALNTWSYHVLEFERGREHSPIEVLAILEHGGDVAKAAKALDEGHSKKAG